MSQTQSPEFNKLRDIFTQSSHKTPADNWVTVTYCKICKHRVGSKKIHDNLHILHEAGLDLDAHHNIIIGKYWELVEGFGKLSLPWTDFEDQGSYVNVQIKIEWEGYTAMTAIDREIRNLLRPSEADKNMDLEQEHRHYYSSWEPAPNA